MAEVQESAFDLGVGIKALSFDGDGTLWDFESVMRAGLRKVLDEVVRIVDDPRAGRLTVDDLITMRDDLAARDPAATPDHQRLRRTAFAVLLEKFGIRDGRSVDHLTRIYFDHRFGTIALYEDTLDTLTALRARFCVELTSNGNNDPERFGLKEHFDFVVFSEQCGFAKPDGRIFAEMLRRANCGPTEAVHVGDSLDNDIQGAQAAGIRAVWLNRSAAPNGTQIKPDATISTLQTLTALL